MAETEMLDLVKNAAKVAKRHQPKKAKNVLTLKMMMKKKKAIKLFNEKKKNIVAIRLNTVFYIFVTNARHPQQKKITTSNHEN